MKVFLVYSIVVNASEPSHYGSYETESLEGIFNTNEQALIKVDELHEKNCKFQDEHPEYDYIKTTVEIRENVVHISN